MASAICSIQAAGVESDPVGEFQSHPRRTGVDDQFTDAHKVVHLVVAVWPVTIANQKVGYAGMCRSTAAAPNGSGESSQHDCRARQLRDDGGDRTAAR